MEGNCLCRNMDVLWYVSLNYNVERIAMNEKLFFEQVVESGVEFSPLPFSSLFLGGESSSKHHMGTGNILDP